MVGSKPIVSILAAFGMMVGVTATLQAGMPRTPSEKDASVYLISPRDGDVVSQTFTVQFGLRGMGIAPAGVDKPKTGHHHLLIDLDSLPALDQPMPANAHLKHFGGGQTETQLTLSPGKHTLQLMLGDKLHIPLDPPVKSEKITITVK